MFRTRSVDDKDDWLKLKKMPDTMRTLELQTYEQRPSVAGQLRLVEKPVPRPGPGQVLVRMAAAPINPSDLMCIRGLYGFKKPLPVVPGFEGSGTVVAAGPGLIPRLWLGRRVGCAAANDGDGTWAEYMVTDALRCSPLLKPVSLEQGAMIIVNPWTAWVLLDSARREKHKAVAHTAAASALGRMMLRLGQRFNYPIVHIVRRQAQVDLLRGMGAAHVLNSSDPDFDEQLRRSCHELGVTLAFDAVAGEMTGRLLDGMPGGGRVTVYGALSESACMVHPRYLIFERKRIEGFWLSDWVAKLNVVSLLRTSFSLQKMLAGELKTKIHARVSLEDAVAGLETYMNEMTRGKILIVPTD